MPPGQVTSARLGVDGDLGEEIRVVERFQDAGPAFGRQVDVADRAVGEQQSQHMISRSLRLR
jgi:hypothetical protein